MLHCALYITRYTGAAQQLILQKWHSIQLKMAFNSSVLLFVAVLKLFHYRFGMTPVNFELMLIAITEAHRWTHREKVICTKLKTLGLKWILLLKGCVNFKNTPKTTNWKSREMCFNFTLCLQQRFICSQFLSLVSLFGLGGSFTQRQEEWTF